MSTVNGPARYAPFANSHQTHGVTDAGHSDLSRIPNPADEHPGNLPDSRQWREQDGPGRRSEKIEDRRRICRRIRREPILVELRSGLSRRRRHQRDSDTLVHVSIKI